jgi:hypothetical protein
MTEYKIESVTPSVKDEIEFYVSADGTKTGMSQRGLARLCGVHKKTIEQLVVKYSGGKTNQEIPENADTIELDAATNSYNGKVIYTELKGINNATILTSDFCAYAVKYFAYEAKKVSDEVRNTCRFVFDKLASKGFDSYVKEFVGYIERHDSNAILDILKDLQMQMSSLTEYKSIREKTTSHFVGLDKMLNELSIYSEDNPDEYISLEGWLWLKEGIILSETKRRSLSILVGQTYKSATGKDAVKGHYEYKDNTGELTKKYNVYLYQPKHFPILRMCLNKVLASEFYLPVI